MQAPGLKCYIMGIVCFHEMRVDGKGKFESFIILEHEVNNENVLIIISSILLL